ncbi:hypothetical protein [Xanthomonas phage JGB6]|nr:hypothetical protein [Xanthomonas phage JGB6]
MNARGIPSVISYTTRAPRIDEVNGKHYYFVTPGEIDPERIVQSVTFAGHDYGSTIDSLENAFKDSDTAVIVVEPSGVPQFKAVAERLGTFEVDAVFIRGKLDVLVTRLVERFQKDPNAKPEYYWTRLEQQLRSYRDWPYYDFYTLYIDEIDDAEPLYSTEHTADLILDTICR